MICREAYMTIPQVIYGRKNFFLLPKLDEKIMLMQAAGLTERWQYQEIQSRKPVEENERDQVPIAIHDLMGSLQLLLIGYLLSVAAFCYELVKAKASSMEVDMV